MEGSVDLNDWLKLHIHITQMVSCPQTTPSLPPKNTHNAMWLIRD